MSGSFYMKQCGAGLLNKNAPGIGEFHGPSFVASEEVKSVVFFEIGDLPAQSRLTDIQSEGSSREIEFFSEDIDSEKVTDLDVGEHGSQPRLRVW